MTFNPKNWYWRVAGDNTKVYSSAAGDYVPIADSTYQAWLLDPEHHTSNIANEIELGGVLSVYSLRPIAAQVLDGYKETQATRLTVEVVAKILLWCVNEIRVLKGQAPVTAQQFKQFVKDQL